MVSSDVERPRRHHREHRCGWTCARRTSACRWSRTAWSAASSTTTGPLPANAPGPGRRSLPGAATASTSLSKEIETDRSRDAKLKDKVKVKTAVADGQAVTFDAGPEDADAARRRSARSSRMALGPAVAIAGCSDRPGVAGRQPDQDASRKKTPAEAPRPAAADPPHDDLQELLRIAAATASSSIRPLKGPDRHERTDSRPTFAADIKDLGDKIAGLDDLQGRRAEGLPEGDLQDRAGRRRRRHGGAARRRRPRLPRSRPRRPSSPSSSTASTPPRRSTSSRWSARSPAWASRKPRTWSKAPQAGQGKRHQGRRREDQEAAGRRRRQGRAQVSSTSKLARTAGAAETRASAEPPGSCRLSAIRVQMYSRRSYG